MHLLSKHVNEQKKVAIFSSLLDLHHPYIRCAFHANLTMIEKYGGDGTAYLMHPIRVAMFIQNFHTDGVGYLEEKIAGALIHDCIEEGKYSLEKNHEYLMEIFDQNREIPCYAFLLTEPQFVSKEWNSSRRFFVGKVLIIKQILENKMFWLLDVVFLDVLDSILTSRCTKSQYKNEVLALSFLYFMKDHFSEYVDHAYITLFQTIIDNESRNKEEILHEKKHCHEVWLLQHECGYEDIIQSWWGRFG